MHKSKKQNNKNENFNKDEKFQKGYILKTKKDENGIEIVEHEEVEYRPVWYMFHTAEIKKTTYLCTRDIYQTEEKAIAMAAYHNAARALRKTQKKWWQIWK